MEFRFRHVEFGVFVEYLWDVERAVGWIRRDGVQETCGLGIGLGRAIAC